jgi:DNA-binding GntR family transcriptional regulator
MEALRKSSGYSPETLYLTLYDAIASHELRPGQKLTEEVIGEVFDVSRSIIRPILRRLAADGVVELFPNRGAYVARPGAKEAREVFAVRRLIEGGMVAQLTNLSPSTIARLRAHVLEEDQARHENDNKRLLRLVGDFHLLLGQITENSVLQGMLRDLVTRSVLATALYQKSEGSGCRTDDHHAIVQLLGSGNSAEAAQFMVDHLHMCEDSLAFDQSGEPARDLRTALTEVLRRR